MHGVVHLSQVEPPMTGSSTPRAVHVQAPVKAWHSVLSGGEQMEAEAPASTRSEIRPHP